MAPFALDQILGKTGMYVVYLFIGVGFGAVLEMAGFADSRRLAAQFYFRNLTVLKVMFTAIVTAMVLLAGASALGMLDMNRVWVPPTYLVPGIVGGLIMGAGFIMGGFCPGTSLVAVANLKVDGMFFFLGATTGVFIFGETVAKLGSFWYSTSLGRFTLPQWLGLEPGVVVLLVVAMALFMFWGGEKLESAFGGESMRRANRRTPLRLAGAATLAAAAAVVMVLGQPTLEDRWNAVAVEKEPLLAERKVQIHPGELLDLLQNDQVRLVLLDVRPDRDYNLFHLLDARHAELAEIERGLPGLGLLNAPANTVVVLISNDELLATQAWKMLTAQSVVNVYLLEGGMNLWLDTFGHMGHDACMNTAGLRDDDTLRHHFEVALGSRHPQADPDEVVNPSPSYTPKVRLEKKKAMGGGCG